MGAPRAEDLSGKLRQALMASGADLVGYADLSALPPGPRQGLPRGVSVAAALDPGIAAKLAQGPTPAYKREYDRVNRLLDRLTGKAARLLRRAGWKAVPKAATHSGIDWDALSTPLPHKTVATRAGLGWIGKNALLVTRELGAALRLATVLTDAPLDVGRPVNASRCGKCVECGRVCPGGAVSGKAWKAGVERAAFFDAHACHRVTEENQKTLGDLICGICIAACPWTLKWLKMRAYLVD